MANLASRGRSGDVRTVVLVASLLFVLGCVFKVDVPWDEVPTSLSLSNTVVAQASYQHIRVSFSDDSNALRYNVYFAEDPTLDVDNYTSLPGGGRAADVTSPYDLTGLASGETWYVLVEWEDENGPGLTTPAVAATTLLSDSLPQETMPFTAGGMAAGDGFGSSIEGIGDYDGDGNLDLVVGSPDGNGAAGRITILRGTPGGPVVEDVFSGGQNNAQLGHAMLFGSDLDNDGAPDLIVGAPGGGVNAAGNIRVLFAADNYDPNTAQSINGPVDNGNLGYTFATTGDVTGDNIDDVLIGAPALTDLAVQGGPWVIDGGDGQLPATGTFMTAASGPVGNGFGTAVSCLPGLNGGFFHYTVGAPQENAGAGRVVAAEASGGLTVSNSRDGQGAEQLGTHIQRLEVNGDLNPDFLVAGLNTVYLFLGVAGGMTETINDVVQPAWSFTAGSIDDLDTADVNGDGRDDVLVGSAVDGAAYLFLADSVDVLTGPARTFTGSSVDAFGAAVAFVDDVTGDAALDIVVGAPNATTSTGEIYTAPGAPTITPLLVPGTVAVNGTTVTVQGFDFTTRPDATYECRVLWGEGTTTVLDNCTPDDLNGASQTLSAARTYRIRVQVEILGAKAAWETDSAIVSEAGVELGLP